MSSRLRNPIIAGVLYDLGFAETKGTGIATMRRLLQAAGLTAPILVSHREYNHFSATYFLHQLLTPEQLQWLRQLQVFELDDNDAKALILVREMGAIDNAALRAVTGLDTLGASALLGRLWKQLGLIEKGGSGSATYYKASEKLFTPSNESDLPQVIAKAIAQLSKKARKDKLWPLVLQLCAWHPCSADELAHYLGRTPSIFKVNDLKPMREDGLIAYVYPEVVNHPEQAYQITSSAQAWLQQKGLF